MSSLNEVNLIGHLGADPEMKSFQNGGKIANLSLATSRKWKDRNSGEMREETEWHRIAILADGLAGIAEKYLCKGSKLYVSGRLKTEKWTDKSGQDRYTTKVIVTGYEGKLILLGSGNSSNAPANSPVKSSAPDTGSSNPPAGPEIDDEIPF